MSAAENSRLERRLAALAPTSTTAQARQALLSPRDLAHLVTEGEIDEPSRGVYRRADAPETARTQICWLFAHGPLAPSCAANRPWPCMS